MYQSVQNGNLRVMGAPAEYIQGWGALAELPHLAARHGFGRVFAVVDAFLLPTLKPRIDAAFAAAGAQINWQVFAGECLFRLASRNGSTGRDKSSIL